MANPTRHVRQLETAADASEDVVAEWQAKYDRLLDAHRKLQKTNNALEDKLLRIVDKFESDKNQGWDAQIQMKKNLPVSKSVSCNSTWLPYIYDVRCGWEEVGPPKSRQSNRGFVDFIACIDVSVTQCG